MIIIFVLGFAGHKNPGSTSSQIMNQRLGGYGSRQLVLSDPGSVHRLFDVELLFRAPAHSSSVWDDYIRSISLLWHHRDLGEEKTEINCHTLSSVLETLAVFNRRRGCDKNEKTAAVWTLIPLPCLITLNTADSVWSTPQLSVYLVFTVWIRADGGDDGGKRADGLEEEGLIHSLFSLIKASDNWRQSEELKASGAPPDEKVSDPICFHTRSFLKSTLIKLFLIPLNV